jgi:hypothetical protein
MISPSKTTGRAALRKFAASKLLRAGVSLVFRLCLIVLAPAAYGQMTGGTINGIVSDPSRAAIPSATVTLLNQDTGEAHAVTSNKQGFYSAPSLLPGRYTLTATHQGFATTTQRDLDVEVGETIVSDLQLALGNVSETVEVSSKVSGVATESATLSNIVNGQTVRDLPLNGRDWTMLAALEPGVHTVDAQTAITVGGSGRGNRGWGTQLSVSGSRPQQNNYRLDGVSINDYSGGGPGGVLGSVLGADAIQEFSVVTGDATADYGKTSGGVLNAITRAGQRKFHGSAYGFFRNSAFDARNYFDSTLGGPPPFSRNQFGATIGGPVAKGTFFFFDYERLRQDLTSTTTATTISQNARIGLLSTGKTVTIDPKVVPFLTLFPVSTPGTDSGDIGAYSFVAPGKTNDDLYTGRIDHNFTDVNTLHGTFLIDNSQTTGPDGTNFTIIGQTSNRRSVSIEDTQQVTRNIINIARLGFSRSVSLTPIQTGAINLLSNDTTLGFLPGLTVGSIQVTGLTTTNGGIGTVAPTVYHYNSFQYYDDVYYERGSHSLKFGGTVERTQTNETGANDSGGRFTFGSVSNLLTNQPTSFVSSLPGDKPTIYIRQTIFGGYIADTWRLAHNFTVNLGVRYEMASVPNERYGHLARLANLTDNAPTLGSPYYANSTMRNVSPRVGFVWDPFNSGLTSVRGAFGLYDTLPLAYQSELLVINDAPYFQSGTVTSLAKGTFPTTAFSLLTGNTLRYAYLQPNPGRSYVEQWSLDLQRQLPLSIVAEVGYSGQHGIHQPFRDLDANVVLPTMTPQGPVWPGSSGTRLNPSVGTVDTLAWVSTTGYNGLNIRLVRESHGVHAGASYTFSKSLDDSSSSTGSNFNNSLIAPFLFQPSLTFGPSDFDLRHSFVFNASWELPKAASAGRSLRVATEGWQVGGIFRASSGLPFSPVVGGDALGEKNANPFDFPDRVFSAECRHPVNPGNPTNYIKTQCFTAPSNPLRLGNSGRNIAVGPGVENLDFSLIKNNGFLSERVHTQLRAEFFNILNHTNFSVPDRTSAQVFSPVQNAQKVTTSFTPIATAGLLKTTATTSRQIQLAFKLTF